MIFLKNYLFVVILYTLANASLKNGYDNLKWGKRLIGKLLTTIARVSVLDCVEECLTRPGCWSFNYKRAAIFCELNYDSDKSLNQNLTDQEGWIFSRRETWPLELTGPCQNSNCEVNEKCKRGSFNSYKCEVAHCHPLQLRLAHNIKPFESEKSVDFGSSHVIKCVEGYNKTGDDVVKCMRNGLWSEVNIYCHKNQTDCQDVLQEGYTKSKVYTIYPQGGGQLEVFCDQHTDSGGWTVIQRRMDGTIDFFRNWEDYKDGFGNKSGEYWLGNHNIHKVVNQGYYELRIEMSDFNNEKKYALYRRFSIGDEAHGYNLHVGDYEGTAGDSLMNHHNGARFYTKDHDTSGHCAQTFKGGWWYNHCHYSNLNGMYLRGNHVSYADGINWRTWHGYHYSLKTTEMKIKRLQNKTVLF